MASDKPPIPLTGADYSKSRVIVSSYGIVDLQRLMQTYGGRPRDWTKKSSAKIFYRGRLIEIHWYECRGIGKFEFKLKYR